MVGSWLTSESGYTLSPNVLVDKIGANCALDDEVAESEDIDWRDVEEEEGIAIFDVEEEEVIAIFDMEEEDEGGEEKTVCCWC